jgi:hypothetical protein
MKATGGVNCTPGLGAFVALVSVITARSFHKPTAAADWGDGVGVTIAGSGGCATATAGGFELESPPQLASISDKTPHESVAFNRDS